MVEATGLMLYERNAALLVGLREDRLVPRPSFFQLHQVRKARADGLQLRIIAHEDVLVFRGPKAPWVRDDGAGRYGHNREPQPPSCCTRPRWKLVNKQQG